MRKKRHIAEQIIKISGGIAAAKGFHASAVIAGIKSSKTPDCGLLLSDKACSAAGAFTTNAVRASSVDWCERLLPAPSIRAAFCNSGNANACTGSRGERDTAAIARLVGRMAGCPPQSVLVASTGVIGHFLPMGAIERSIPALYHTAIASDDRGSAFAGAIMTTDTKKKEYAIRVLTPQGRYAIGGCAKGSGMIHPNLATMLAFITTDASIAVTTLDAIVRKVVDRTFNTLTVDGDTSTNDMVLVLANGMAGMTIARPSECKGFERALFTVCDSLCKKIAEDGEGATKRVEIRVCGGKTYGDAKSAAKAVANSNLVKTALFGNDPNWGRILCAVGYSGARFSKENLTLSLCGRRVFKNMRPVAFSPEALRSRMKNDVVTIDIDLGMGTQSAVAHTCDLTYDYIKINAEYHT